MYQVYNQNCVNVKLQVRRYDINIDVIELEDVNMQYLENQAFLEYGS